MLGSSRDKGRVNGKDQLQEHPENGRGEGSQPSRPDGQEPSAAPIKRLEAALATNQPTGT